MIKVEDRMVSSPVIERPRGTTPLTRALKQMGFRVGPITSKLIKGLPRRGPRFLCVSIMCEPIRT